MKKFTLRLLLPLLFSGLIVTHSKAQIAGWDFTGQNAGPATVAATTFNANLVSASGANNITRGAGAAGSSANNSFRTVGFKNDGIAVTNTDYFQITLTAQAGFNLSLSSIDAFMAGTATYAAAPGVSTQFAYSLDGTNFTLIGSPAVSVGTPATLATVNLSGITALQNVAATTTITLRFYATGQTATGGWGFISSATGVNGLAIGGTLNSANPTPTTTSISPASATAGGAAFPITVNGTNFVSGSSTVTWNGSNRTTTFVSATQLTANITAADILTAGTATVGVTTSGAPAASNTQTFTINASAGPTLSLGSALPDFGNVCLGTTSAASSFSIDGSNLTGTNITVAALPGFTYSTTAGGTYTSTLSLSYTGNSFTGKVVYVKFSPTAVQSYNGTITLSGGGVASYPIAATGAGVNTLPTVTTGGATLVGATTATVAGTLTSVGCGSLVGYGIEYSTSSGFPEGTGTQVPASNLSGGNFSVNLTGLAPNTRIYYKAYGVNTIDTTYGTQQAFTNTPLPVVMVAQPALTYTETFADIANWSNFFISGIGANHFTGLSAATGTGSIPNGTTFTASTQSFQSGNPGTSGGVQKGTDQLAPIPSTESIILLSTGSPDNTTASAIDLYLDFTSVNAGTLSFDYQSFSNSIVAGSANDRAGSLRIYTSPDGVTFTELPAAAVLNFINNTPISGSITNIALPASFNMNPNARVRFYYSNGNGGTNGSRPKISIDNLSITAIPTTPCVKPTAPATALTFGTISDVAIQGSFTAASPAADEYLVVMSNNSSLTSNPVDGQVYNIGDNVGDGTVIARASATSFSATGLSPLTNYYFFVIPINSICLNGPMYYTTTILNKLATTIAGLPPCVAPTTQPTGLILTATGINTVQGSFTATTAKEYLVLRSTSATLTATPVNAQTYNADDVLGNAVVVQRGITTSFVANGLLPETKYYFYVFALNSVTCINGPVYNTTAPLTNNSTTPPLPPCAAPGYQASVVLLTASNTAISGSFVGVTSADDYVVVRSTSPTLSASPVDNNNYAVGSNFGGGIVVANSSNTTFLTQGLTSNTTYYFFVFAANKNCSGGTKYAKFAPATESIVTGNALVNNTYFGTLHSHSDYSDGNKDHPNYTPTDDYTYAITAQCMDYLGISEHNHYSGGDPGNVISKYHTGITQATAFTAAHPNFLALYGMEWGVISGGGHVVVYGDGMNNLWGWESGSGGWGPTNNYDVYVPKSVYTGSTGLFKTINDNIGTNTFATLAHPNLTDYNNIAGTAYNASADSAITGSAVESGPALSTSTTYSNPGSSMSYLWYFQTLLAKGYHLGPTIDHDNHNTTFGHTTYSRTAVVAPALTKTALISAMRNMNFYATQDCDSKVDFTINTKIMGSTVIDRFGPNIAVTLTDATTATSSAVIRVMFGIPGSGILPVKIDSVIGNTLTFTDNSLANLATGYYYIDITNGTSRIVTSPIWYTRYDAYFTPDKIGKFSVQAIDRSAKLIWSTEKETATVSFNIERSTDGSTWSSIGTVNAAGNSSNHIDYSFYDNNPFAGYNYYRLKLTDATGKVYYSYVRSAFFYATAAKVTVAPNPAKDFINISLVKTGNQQASIQLMNADGKTVYSTMSALSFIQINTKAFGKGVYFLKVVDIDKVTTIKVLVQ